MPWWKSTASGSSASSFDPALVHSDLGPEHILCRHGDISGVIDWGDARVGDPAIDYAWPLYGTNPAFAEALAAHEDATLARRALFYHRLGPWHEVLYRLDEQRPELVASGLEGIRGRFPEA
jgi:aminoglycoside phosphotransferase (APT) family kinase protein